MTTWHKLIDEIIRVEVQHQFRRSMSSARAEWARPPEKHDGVERAKACVAEHADEELAAGLLRELEQEYNPLAK